MIKIQLQVASYKFVKLIVFNLPGKKVATLINEELQPGTYKVSFNARLGGSSTDLPSGVFLQNGNK